MQADVCELCQVNDVSERVSFLLSLWVSVMTRDLSRCPHCCRYQLHMIRNGEPGKKVVGWMDETQHLKKNLTNICGDHYLMSV